MIQPDVAVAFAVHENPKAFALLLGSGVSRSAMIPTGWEITLDLVRRVGRLQGAEEQADWAAWHQSTTGQPPSYSELLDRLSHGPDERRAILHSYIEASSEDRAEGRRTPTPAHRAIARLVADGFVRVIITTNFDRLLEEALRELGIQPTVLGSDDAIAGAAPLIHSGCCILKVHGDYLDTRIRNTEAELTAYSPVQDALLDRILDEHGLIVCGWSGEWDPALRAAILRAPSRRYPLFWVSRGEPTPLAADLIAARAGRVIKADGADGFFVQLAERVALQQDLAQPNPRSVALLVAAAKRYVARPDHRVQLHDLLAEEAKRLDAVLPDSQTVMNLSTEAQFVAWVRKVEAAAEPLARVLSVLGRWGDEAEADAALRLIRGRLLLPALTGLTHMLALRAYPAILCAYAFGVGAAAAGRLDVLHRLFTQPVSQNGRNALPFVREHFLDRWGGAHGSWKALTDPLTDQGPLSRHLHDLFSAWASDIALDRLELDAAFVRFELMGALETILTDPKAEALKLEGAPKARPQWIWAPLGRALAAPEHAESALDHWESPVGLQVLAAAGVAHETVLEPALAHLRDQLEQHRPWT